MSFVTLADVQRSWLSGLDVHWSNQDDPIYGYSDLGLLVGHALKYFKLKVQTLGILNLSGIFFKYTGFQYCHGYTVLPNITCNFYAPQLHFTAAYGQHGPPILHCLGMFIKYKETQFHSLITLFHKIKMQQREMLHSGALLNGVKCKYIH